MSEGLQSPLTSPLQRAVDAADPAQRVEPAAHGGSGRNAKHDPQDDSPGRKREHAEKIPMPSSPIEDQVTLSDAARERLLSYDSDMPPKPTLASSVELAHKNPGDQKDASEYGIQYEA